MAGHRAHPCGFSIGIDGEFILEYLNGYYGYFITQIK